MPTSEPTIFIIDDDEPVCRAMTRSLTLRGYHVKAYASGEAFLAAYQSDQSGCLLLDIGMPGMSGLELRQELQHRQISLPIIFITGHGELLASNTRIELSHTDILEKPYPVHLLAQKIDQLLADI